MNTKTNLKTTKRTIPEVPKNAGEFGESRLYGWLKSIRNGPTYAFLHECGSRAAMYQQGKTNPTTVYHCPQCDVTLPLHSSYGFEEVEVSE